MRTRHDADFTFTWYSHMLAEIQSAAHRLSTLGIFQKGLKQSYAKEIDENVESVRKFLLEELFRGVE